MQYNTATLTAGIRIISVDFIRKGTNMAKYYAVKNGYHTGIFRTWEECRKEVSGYSGAEYKSFTSRADAENYLGNSDDYMQITFDMSGGEATAYVDGSYNVNTGEFSYGAVVFHNGEEKCFNEKFYDEELSQMRNVAGEIAGAMRVMRYCTENDISHLELYYDYEGIEKWCTGVWKTNKSGTIAYKEYFDSIKDSVNVRFHKVKGHSGDKYNDMADELAKEALGIK